MQNEQVNGASARIAERAVGERSDLGAARPVREGVPDPELVERATRVADRLERLADALEAGDRSA